MAKDKIPVYNIHHLQLQPVAQGDFLAEHFSDYLHKHYEHLHFPHRHNFYHLVLFINGKGSHTVDFNKYTVKPYQVYCMIPGQVHSWHFTSPINGYVINFSAGFYKNFLLNERYLDNLSFFSGNSKDGVFQLPVTLHEEITVLFEKLIDLQKQPQPAYDLIRVILLQLLLLMDGQAEQKRVPAIPNQKLTLLNNFKRLIDAHYKSIRLPKEYADLLYVTPNHLNALCQDLLGKTAGELIRERILLEAKRLLTNVNMTVTEIAYELNFQDNSYFNRFFKKYEQVTPDDFRKQFSK